MKYIIANWKMNMNLESITDWINTYSKKSHTPDAKVIIAPSALHIPLIKEVENNLKISVASQNISINEKGAHTGEIGAFQVRELCNYSIIGHSELKESIDEVITKRDLCLSNNITPIVCFTKIEDVQILYTKGCLMAWEDPQNISVKGQYNEKPESEIISGIDEIRKLLPKEKILIYGGSVNQNNIKTIKNIKDINGVLVGNASLDPTVFADIIQSYI